MNDTHDNSVKPLMLPWIQSPQGVINIYANSLHVTWSLDDVRLRLAHVAANPEHPNPGPEFQGATVEDAGVTLSWRLTKILRDQLTKVIENYEKTNGEIRTDIKLPMSVNVDPETPKSAQ